VLSTLPLALLAAKKTQWGDDGETVDSIQLRVNRTLSVHSATYDECDADGEYIPGNGEGITNHQAGRNFGFGNDVLGVLRRGASMDQTMFVVLIGVLVPSMYTDLRSSRIPNWLTFSIMGFALVGHAWLGGIQGALFSLAGLGAGLGLFLILYVTGSIGAGDVKLMAAVGAMVGPYGALVSGLLAIMVGGLYALGAMCYQWGFVATGRKLASAAHGALLTGGKVWAQELQLPFRLRYGLAVAGGTLLFQLGLHPFGR
jgi:prepilin peptidase CpaA